MTTGNNVVLLISAFVYFQISFFLLRYFDENVNRPYMDEIFHVPQAQQYCRGNYNEWNNKITTLPGLYLLSTSILRAIALVLNREDHVELCTLYNLRLSNVILSTLNYIVIFKIFAHLHSKRIENNSHAKLITVLSSFAISLFPLNYFFQFLYYTDSGSTLFVLLSYYFQLKKSYQLSAYTAVIAIIFRQTNVIWLVFSLSLLLIGNLEQLASAKNNNKDKEANKNIGKVDATTMNTIVQNRSKKHSTLVDLMSKTPNEAFNKDFNLLNFIKKVYREDLTGKRLLFADLTQIIDLIAIQPYVLGLLLFGFFVFVNNGIVVGDRDNHQASLHLTQLFYFVSFAYFFSLSSFLFAPKKIKNFIQWLRSNLKFVFLVALPLSCVLVHNFTYEHPFLLADNRHYTFYVWSKLFRRHELIKYAVTPIYIACAYFFYRNLTLTGKSIAWLIAYSVCVIAVLVPQKLIEFRYFIVPFYIYRLNINQTTLKEILLEIVFYGAVNALTIYVFFYKTFVWSNDPTELQRFMW